jgi:hypothetical protein
MIASVERMCQEDIHQLENNLLCPFGHQVLDFSKQLFHFTGYIERYREFKDALDKVKPDNDLRALYAQLEDPNNPFSRGVKFDGILIQPIQRPTRIPLLLAEIRKATPPDHPDWRDIDEAWKSSKIGVVGIDKWVDDCTRQVLEDFRKRGLELPRGPGPGHQYRSCDEIQGAKRLLLIFWSDELNVCKVRTRNRLKLLGVAAWSRVGIEPFGAKSLLLRCDGITLPGSSLTYQCETKGKRDALFDSYRVIVRERFVGNLEFTEIAVAAGVHSLALACHGVFAVGTDIWVFGGVQETGLENDNLLRVNTAVSPAVIEAQDRGSLAPIGRVNFPYSCSGSSLYIFGGALAKLDGLQEGGKRLQEESVWEFSAAVPRAWKRRNAGASDFPKGAGCALAPFPDYLMLVGGTEHFEIWKFPLQTERWEKVNSVRQTANRWRCHSAFPLETGDVLAFTGVTLMRVYLISNRGRKIQMLETRGCPPLVRAFPAVARIGQYFIVFGDEKETMPVIFDLAGQEWFTPEITGFKVQLTIDRFAVSSGKDCCWLHGGATGGKLRPALFKVVFATRAPAANLAFQQFRFDDLLEDCAETEQQPGQLTRTALKGGKR